MLTHKIMEMETRMRISELFGDRAMHNAALSKFTAARVGGAADSLLIVESVTELRQAVFTAYKNGIPFLILGGGSNVLISDRGIRELVILNKAREIHFGEVDDAPFLWAGSGVNFGLLARQAASRGFSGLEWAVGIPGTLGGAVYGNAGAHGKEIGDNIIQVELLLSDGSHETWSREKMDYEYRDSILKRNPSMAVILAAALMLQEGDRDEITERITRYAEFRHETQPPGASMGSMFKNPPNDYAGRLIDQAGLKGTMFGNVEISSKHANFFINHGDAAATDIYQLIMHAQETVKEKFGVQLELEIELIGEWGELQS